MCLYIDKEKHPDLEPLVAKQDILVWKFLRSPTNESPYKRFRYKPNTTYKSIKMVDSGNTIARIEEGYHSWQSRSRARSENLYNNKKVVKFFIPKGSKYFFGNNGDIVSSRIRSGDLKSQ